MDYKKLIERLQQYSQSLIAYKLDADFADACEDAVAAISTLQSENDRLRKERDAAVENIPHECKNCLYHTGSFNGCTPDHDCSNPDGGCSNNYDRWVWRGIKED